MSQQSKSKARTYSSRNPDTSYYFPLNTTIWEWYKKSVTSFGQLMDLTQDMNDWEIKLTDNDRKFIKRYVLAFLPAIGIVNRKPRSQFHAKYQIPKPAASWWIPGSPLKKYSRRDVLSADRPPIKDAKKRTSFSMLQNLECVSKKETGHPLDWECSSFCPPPDRFLLRRGRNIL